MSDQMKGSAMDAGFSNNGRPAQWHGDRTVSSQLQLSVRRARHVHDLRRKLLGSEYFTGPAWEILLHLFESHVMQRKDTIGNVCDGAEIPATTALRWMYRLEECGMLHIRDDHLDNRRRFVALSDAGAETIRRYFDGIAPHPIAA